MDSSHGTKQVYGIGFILNVTCNLFKITYIDILAEDTVDERIVKALRKKINIATQVMGEELKDWI